MLTEAPAILRYIAARHPSTGLWPWEPREEARCAEWLNWLSSTIHVAFVHRAPRIPLRNRASRDRGRRRHREKDLPRTLAGGGCEDRGRAPGRIGERYSVADPYLLVYWIWGRGPALAFDMAQDFPHWTAHARRLAARPAVLRAFASEGLALPRKHLMVVRCGGPIARGSRRPGSFVLVRRDDRPTQRLDELARLRHRGDVLHRIFDGGAVPVGIHRRAAILRNDDEIALVAAGASGVLD